MSLIGTSSPDLGTKDELIPIGECKDIEFLIQCVSRLWALLDDIDSAGDVAKDNNAMYRKHCEYLQTLRWELPLRTDGYGLFKIEKKNDTKS